MDVTQGMAAISKNESANQILDNVLTARVSLPDIGGDFKFNKRA